MNANNWQAIARFATLKRRTMHSKWDVSKDIFSLNP